MKAAVTNAAPGNANSWYKLYELCNAVMEMRWTELKEKLVKTL